MSSNVQISTKISSKQLKIFKNVGKRQPMNSAPDVLPLQKMRKCGSYAKIIEHGISRTISVRMKEESLNLQKTILRAIVSESLHLWKVWRKLEPNLLVDDQNNNLATLSQLCAYPGWLYLFLKIKNALKETHYRKI